MKIFETDASSPSAKGDSTVWEYRSDRPFGSQLWWHVEVWGTKPAGSPSTTTGPWARKDFAKAIGRTPQGIGKWYKNEGVPYGVIEQICAVLFGENQDYKIWKEDLLKAYAKLKKPPSQSDPDPSLDIRISTYFNAPPTIPEFHARVSELQDLEAYFFGDHSEKSAKIAIIHGFSGLGKTALATEFAHRYLSRFRGVVWLRADTQDAITSGFAKFSKSLNRDTKDNAEPKILIERAFSYLSQQKDPWLVVYDDVTEPTQCKGLLLKSPVCTLITSRFSDWTHFGKSIPLDPFSLEDSARLLQYVADRDDAVGANQLARVLGRLPLALNHAGITCRRAKLEFASYAKNAEVLLREPLTAVDYPTPVHVAIRMAVDQIPSINNSHQLLWFLAHCNGSRIETDWLEIIFGGSVEFIRSLLPLTDYSLVRIAQDVTGKKYLIIHNLVQLIIRSLATESGFRAASARELFECLYLLYPRIEFISSALEQSESLTPHLISLLKHSLEYISDLEHLPKLLSSCGFYLFGQGSYYLSDYVLRAGHRICSERLQSMKIHPWTISAKWEQLLSPKYHEYFHSPKFDSAERELRTQLNEFEVTLLVLFQTKRALAVEIDLDEILFLQERILAFAFINDGPKSLECCARLCEASSLYSLIGETEKSLDARLAARFIFKFLYKPQDFIGNIIFISFVEVLFENKSDRRQFLEDQCFAAHNKLDLDHLEYIEFMKAAGYAQRELGDNLMAFQTNKAVYFACRDLYEDNHAEIARSYFNVGISVITMGKQTIGMKTCEKALDSLAKIYGSHSPFVVTARNSMFLEVMKSSGIAIGSIYPLYAEAATNDSNPDF